jgi:hypothetical protein
MIAHLILRISSKQGLIFSFNMNRVLLAAAMITLCFCNRNKLSTTGHSTSEITIKLVDSLGYIRMSTPGNTDTFFSWIRLNDCGKPCEEGKYRFQSKRFPIFKESGFYWTGEPTDSVNQLTISHQRADKVMKNNDSFALYMFGDYKQNLKYDPDAGKVISDTVQKIGDRYFCIFNIANVDKKRGVLIRRVLAYTSIAGYPVKFKYELLTRNQDSLSGGFFDHSIKNLQTVRIKDGG